jgi:hypothetical protein
LGFAHLARVFDKFPAKLDAHVPDAVDQPSHRIGRPQHRFATVAAPADAQRGGVDSVPEVV